jgi:hypothetical protein
MLTDRIIATQVSPPTDSRHPLGQDDRGDKASGDDHHCVDVVLAECASDGFTAAVTADCVVASGGFASLFFLHRLPPPFRIPGHPPPLARTCSSSSPSAGGCASSLSPFFEANRN